ncbi:hypothetical protein [Paraburkholderia adhaesiva]|uniref:hypothetical protein n=1 Tax=Paraburkholderia adhaesiva TaxID=2883244 RepID=UPI001F409B72|nr:hypothetical protein [Paraburkholderia adhaesiva]
MDPKHLVRDPQRVKSALVETPDGKLVAKDAVKISIPTRFAERGLAEVGIETFIYGVYAITVEDSYYGVSLVNAMIRIEPTSMMKILVGEDEYYEFEFEKGAVITPSLNLVKNDALVYRIFNEMLAGAHVPWYIGYNEMACLLDSAKYHAGANVGRNHDITELLVSIISRNPRNRHEFYRTVVKGQHDLLTNPPVFIPLRSIEYAATSALNKVAGSYFSRGVVSALVSPSTRVERLNDILAR